MTKVILQLGPLGCPSCMQKIQRHVKALDGVSQDAVEIVFNASKLAVKYDPDITTADQIKQSVEDLGYDVLKIIMKETAN